MGGEENISQVEIGQQETRQDVRFPTLSIKQAKGRLTPPNFGVTSPALSSAKTDAVRFQPDACSLSRKAQLGQLGVFGSTSSVKETEAP